MKTMLKNDYLTQTLLFLDGVELKKKLLPEKMELTLYFMKVEYLTEYNVLTKIWKKFVHDVIFRINISIHIYVYIYISCIYILYIAS